MIIKYIPLIKRIAKEDNKESIDVVVDVMNTEATIKYIKNRLNYERINQSYFLLAIGKVQDKYKRSCKLWILRLSF